MSACAVSAVVAGHTVAVEAASCGVVATSVVAAAAVCSAAAVPGAVLLASAVAGAVVSVAALMSGEDGAAVARVDAVFVVGAAAVGAAGGEVLRLSGPAEVLRGVAASGVTMEVVVRMRQSVVLKEKSMRLGAVSGGRIFVLLGGSYLVAAAVWPNRSKYQSQNQERNHRRNGLSSAGGLEDDGDYSQATDLAWISIVYAAAAFGGSACC